MAEFMNIAFSVFFVVLFIVSVVVFIVLTFQSFHEWLDYINTPQETHTGKVVSRKVDSAYKGATSRISGSYVVLDIVFEVTFELENKEQIAFYIPMEEYAKLNEGDSGKLIFKKNRYISFEKEQKDHTDENTK